MIGVTFFVLVLTKGGVARLAGIESPSFPDDESTFEELDARIAKTVVFLRSVDAKLFD